MSDWIFLNFYSKQEMDKEEFGELQSAVIHLFYSDLNPPRCDCHTKHIWAANINCYAHVHIQSCLKTEPWLQRKPVNK